MLRKTQTGYTLVELMITVGILGILAAIAIPSYQQYTVRANRVDATSELLRLTAEQEKYYLQNNSYATEAQLAGFITAGENTLTTQKNVYNIAITGAGGADSAAAYQQGFVITAAPSSSNIQSERDTDCQSIAVDAAGQRTAKNKANKDSSNDCW